MSQVTIKLLKSVDITKPNASKSYKQMVVTHTDGKDTTGKKIFDFSTPKHVWDTLAAAKEGDAFVITREKDAKEGKYWEWKDIGPADATAVAAPVAAAPSATVPAKVGNWETSDERAKKQVYIVRQSNIAQAISLHTARGDLSLVSILQTAKALENYVFGDGVAGLTDDQPE